MKITILWSTLASYSVAFFKELAQNRGCQLQLIYQPIKTEVPYEDFDLSFCEISLEDSQYVKKNLEKLVDEYNPNFVLMSSWAFPHFMRLCRRLRSRGVFVVSAMDNQWKGSLMQKIGIIFSRWFLKPSIDTFLVTGDRQAFFARKLGYEDVLYGLYAAEVDRFTVNRTEKDWPRNFLFVGRLIHEKGIKLLIAAYNKYRKKSIKPWNLNIVGGGPLSPLLDGVAGVKYHGFIQPSGLPPFMRNAGCFVLPSLFEPWGVVIHEACAAGLPVIATYHCGATTYFMRDGINGYIVPPRVEALTNAMLNISELTNTDLQKMSQASLKLASTWTPYILAEYFYSSIRQRISK